MKKRVKKHPLEEKYPEQCKEYKKIADKAYILFLKKGMEYGTSNVRMLGLLGLSLRLMEKVVRLLTIQGWNVWTGTQEAKIDNPEFGSINQELQDIFNIAIIASIIGRGKWGK